MNIIGFESAWTW